MLIITDKYGNKFINGNLPIKIPLHKDDKRVELTDLEAKLEAENYLIELAESNYGSDFLANASIKF